VYLSYQGQECFYKYHYTYNEAEKDLLTWDSPEGGMSKACDLINQLSLLLVGKDLTQFKKIDDAIKNFKIRKEEQGETVGINVTSAVSQSLFYAFASAQNPRSPFQSIFKQTTLRQMKQSDRSPSLMFTVLNGGKDLSSKIKFSKFFLILGMTP
jgi:enolase